MTKNKWRISATLPAATRAHLLRVIPPRFDQVFARSVTWAYGVPEVFEFPQDVADMTIYGHHQSDSHEAALVAFAGRRFRPDGKRLFLTISTATGVAPAAAGEIDESRIRYLDEKILFGVSFERHPLWKMQPQQRQLVAA